MSELEQSKREFGMELDIRCKEHDVNQRRQVKSVADAFSKKNAEKLQRTTTVLTDFRDNATKGT